MGLISWFRNVEQEEHDESIEILIEIAQSFDIIKKNQDDLMQMLMILAKNQKDIVDIIEDLKRGSGKNTQ